MDTKFQTSFIPKKPLIQTRGIPTSHHINFFSIIITLFLIIALVGAGFVFTREHYLTGKIARMAADLAAAEASLNDGQIDEWVRLDRRIEVGKELLNNHLAISSFFDLLEDMTLSTIQFRDFKYAVTSEQEVTVAMTGQADSFAALALQSDELAIQSESIKNQLFSDIDQDRTTGKVKFKFSALVDPSLISYKKVVEGTQNQNVEGEIEPVLPEVEATTTSPVRTLPRTNDQGTSTNN